MCGVTMNKKSQLFIRSIILLTCISAIVSGIKSGREENAEKSYKDVNVIIQEDKSIQNTDIYDTFLKNFNGKGEEYYYSFIELAGYDYPILLLSNGVYEFNNEKEAALWTDIYYPVDTKITKFGYISSGGTAYPISSDTTGIYTAGGHEVTKYGLDTQNQKLELISKYIMFFHKTEQGVKSVTVGIIDGENKIVSEKEFDQANQEYGNANIIYFKRLRK